MGVSDLRPIKLTDDRIAGALALSSEAGWNQIEADWRFMLASGSSFGFTTPDDKLVASGLTVNFPLYAWISMVLVTPAWRRQGLATRLMRDCVDAIHARGIVPALDASPEGREVYLRLGFRDAGRLTRLFGDVGGMTAEPVPGLDEMTEEDFAEVADYDAASSGTDRSELLRHLRRRLPEAAFIVRRAGKVAGYVLARRGRMSPQIGPLVAEDDATAIALLSAAGMAVGGPVCLDLFDQRGGMRAWLDARGFVPLTLFIRMVLGSAEIFPAEHRVYVIGGPELS